ncbi:MAG: shikimate kinase [Firmicutes bacterium]|nr:shikimate kinase [Bacillota bacterium]
MDNKTNIVLLGFMGSGKTVIGRQAARLLDFDFADTDEEIREITGMDLPRLYKKHGEIRCRSEEKLLISKLARRDNTVIACGGSLPPQPENLRLLAEKGWFVLLTAEPEIIRSRIARKRDRLLVNGKVTPEFITRQACSWESSYAGLTDCRIDSGRMGVDEAAEAIASAWRERGRQA